MKNSRETKRIRLNDEFYVVVPSGRMGEYRECYDSIPDEAETSECRRAFLDAGFELGSSAELDAENYA